MTVAYNLSNLSSMYIRCDKEQTCFLAKKYPQDFNDISNISNRTPLLLNHFIEFLN
jgi:hypothetical protein